MRRNLSPLLIALVLAMVAFVVGWSGLKRKQAEMTAGLNLVPVLVAATDLAEGTEVVVDQMAQREVPSKFVTASVLAPESMSYVVNQKLLVPLLAGDLLLWSHFNSARPERLSAQVTARYRAFTIEARGVTAVGGWVRPNDHVDIVGVFKDPKSNEPIATTLLQNVLVQATGKLTGTTNVKLVPLDQRSYGDVTLQLTAEEVEMMMLARELGTLALSLRNSEDPGVIGEQGRTGFDTLFNRERLQQIQEKRDKDPVIIRGNNKN